MQTLVATLDFIFGCHHTNLSRVFTIEGRTYRVCCDCGAKFEYSLESMRMERCLSTHLDRSDDDGVALIPSLLDHSRVE
jgi:hypothetical protein